MIYKCCGCNMFLGEGPGGGISDSFCPACLKVEAERNSLPFMADVIVTAQEEEAIVLAKYGPRLTVEREPICAHLVSLSRGTTVVHYRCTFYGGEPRCHLKMDDARFLSIDADCVNHCTKREIMSAEDYLRATKKKEGGI